MDELLILEFLREQRETTMEAEKRQRRETLGTRLDINDFNQFGATCLVVYLSLHIQRALVELNTVNFENKSFCA